MEVVGWIIYAIAWIIYFILLILVIIRYTILPIWFIIEIIRACIEYIRAFIKSAPLRKQRAFIKSASSRKQRTPRAVIDKIDPFLFEKRGNKFEINGCLFASFLVGLVFWLFISFFLLMSAEDMWSAQWLRLITHVTTLLSLLASLCCIIYLIKQRATVVRHNEKQTLNHDENAPAETAQQSSPREDAQGASGRNDKI